MTAPGWGSARRVVIAVFDGLRPDRISAERTPNLARFARRGVWYRRSRSVFPSMTRVATTSIATGVRPAGHGIVDNAFFDRSVIAERPIDTASWADLAAAEARYGGRFVGVPGLGCVLAAAGKRYAVVHGGSIGSAYMINHRAAANGHWTFSIHGRGATQTPEAVDAVEARLGPRVLAQTPKLGQVDYVARAFTDHVLAERRPDVALVWFPEPDSSYHEQEIGSGAAEAVTRRVDARFGEILAAVEGGPAAAETLVMALSDHGQISMNRVADLFGWLTAAGFPTASRDGPEIEVLATGGSTCGLWLKRRDPARLKALAQALMAWPETGMLFARAADRIEGAFALDLVGLDHPRAGDLIWVARSEPVADQHGLLGVGAFTGGGGVPLGGGMHGGLSQPEQNTVLMIGGAGTPALGAIDDPADLTDIAPTALAALGLSPAATMTGRPLSAALGGPRLGASAEILETGVETGSGAFRQQLTRLVFGGRAIPFAGGRG